MSTAEPSPPRWSGLAWHNNPRATNAEQIDQAVELCASGLSLAKVGSQLGFTARTIRAELLKRDVKMRPRPGW